MCCCNEEMTISEQMAQPNAVKTFQNQCSSVIDEPGLHNIEPHVGRRRHEGLIPAPFFMYESSVLEMDSQSSLERCARHGRLLAMQLSREIQTSSSAKPSAWLRVSERFKNLELLAFAVIAFIVC